MKNIYFHLVSVIVLLGFVSACAYAQLDDVLTPLKGQPLSAAVAKLGNPSEELTVSGQKVYVWEKQRGKDEDGDDQECKIRATMDGGVVRTLKFQGDETQCYRYALTLQKSRN